MSHFKDNEIQEQAIRWFTWLRDNKVDPEYVDVFLRWRSTSVLHQQAYDKVESLWQSCDGVDILDLPWPNQTELQFDTYDGSYPLALPKNKNPLLNDLDDVAPHAAVDLVLGDYPQVPNKSWLHWAGLAAMLVFVTVTISVTVLPKLDIWGSHEQVYITPVAQQRKDRLDDGSVVTLGGSSEVIVDFNKVARNVTLKRGEAFFEIAKDPKRPFIVNIGDSTVKAVGTAFNINKRGDSVTVSVLEGIISVAHKGESSSSDGRGLRLGEEHRFTEGQQLTYDSKAQRWHTVEGRLQRAKLWREGQLAYENERLGAILQDINRYSNRPLEIADSELAELRYTGTVFNDNVIEWLSALQESFPVKVLELDDRIVLLKS